MGHGFSPKPQGIFLLLHMEAFSPSGATVSLHTSSPRLVPSAPLKTFALGGSGIREAEPTLLPRDVQHLFPAASL